LRFLNPRKVEFVMSQTLDFALPSPQTVTREDFPAYVEAEILRTSGPQVPCPRSGEILLAFWDRLGPGKAMAACARAFGPCRGYWRGAPVTPLRFDGRQDDFFALPLLGAGPGE
jgi:hypothetical protein